eukprot:766140-Hanusia_phi.AAC.1
MGCKENLLAGQHRKSRFTILDAVSARKQRDDMIVISLYVGRGIPRLLAARLLADNANREDQKELENNY